MFNNPGKKIKGYAKVIFWLIEFFVFVTTITIIFAASRSNSLGIGVFIGLLLFAIGTIAAWITTLFLVAYGEMIDDIEQLAISTKETNTILENQLKEIAASISSSKQA